MLTLEIYRITAEFPKHEIYGLTSQIRRAAVSIGANIAEGCGKESNLEFARFLQIAAGSASELENHLLLSADLGFLEKAPYERLAHAVVELKKMLFAFSNYVGRRQRNTKRL